MRDHINCIFVGTSMSAQFFPTYCKWGFGKIVHLVIEHASWVQIDVNQVGLYLLFISKK